MTPSHYAMSLRYLTIQNIKINSAYLPASKNHKFQVEEI